VNVRGYAWYFAAFGALLASGGFIALAALTFLASMTPLYASLVCSLVAIACAVVAWRRRPHGDTA
jgi:hypothetical protein